jgi:hypothetical protein
MASNGVSTNFSISSAGSSSEEVDAFRLLLDSDLCADVVSICQKTPAQLLMEQEEKDEVASDILDTRKQVVGALLSFIFKPVKNRLPSVFEVSTRVWILTYLCAPSLINALSLQEIGKLLGEAFDTPDLSRQLLSARSRKMSSSLNIIARSQKSQTSNEKYSALAKERWADKKEEEKEKKRIEYMKAYREANRDKKRENDKIYYAANRKRILDSRRKKRRNK